MFKNFSIGQQELLYLGLKSLIESKSGKGFHNNDTLTISLGRFTPTYLSLFRSKIIIFALLSNSGAKFLVS